ncbi:hypothetical protein PFISCL1PPCAC_2288, partial [Pristionchus fissidentatus]
LFQFIVFGGFVIIYICSVMYLNYYIFRRLKDLKPSVSEKTFDILERMSLLFAYVIASPIVFFHIPHLLFVVCNYYLPELVATRDALIYVTITIASLFALFPFSFYVFLLCGFKQYRIAFFHLLTFRRFEPNSSPSSSRH